MTLLMSRRRMLAGSLLALPALAGLPVTAQARAADDRLGRIVDSAVGPVIEAHKVPGMAVAVTVQGRPRFFCYGVASKQTGQKVTQDTIFEIGSVSKTFTATLGCYAQARGKISFDDKASKYLPALAGSSFDNITLLDLATFTAGGLPLQFPGGVTDRNKMIAYFRTWRPVHPPGTYRLYSNPSIGLFGDLAARSMGKPFDELMQEGIFPAFGLADSFIRVPKSRMPDYAMGYWKGDKPIRVAPGMFDSEAYGVKTTASDLIRFIQANMDGLHLDKTMQDAVAATHTGYYTVGPMTQGVAWEMYDEPTDLRQLLAGNSDAMAFQAHKVHRLVPPRPPRQETLVNKTGSTNGFGAYAAFIPARRIGIAILANRNIPIPARVEAAYRILTALKA